MVLSAKRVLANALNEIIPALGSLHQLLPAHEARALTHSEGRRRRAEELAGTPNPETLERSLTLAAAVAQARPHLRRARNYIRNEFGISDKQARAVLFVTLEHLDEDDDSPFASLVLELDKLGVDRRLVARAAGRNAGNLRKTRSKARSKARRRTRQ